MSPLNRQQSRQDTNEIIITTNSNNPNSFNLIGFYNKLTLFNYFQNLLQMELQGVCNIVSLVFTVIGGIFIYIQWQKNIKIKRAEFIQQILEKLRFDKRLSNTMYLLDYNPEWYNNNFHTSSIELDVDRLLSYLNYICYMKSTRVISGKEFEALKYHVHRSLISRSSQIYLWNIYIYHFAKSNNTLCSFSYLIDYGIANNLLPAKFKRDKTLYPKRLNFN